MKYAIVTDSSCDLKSLPSSHNNTIYLQAPLSLRIGNREFIDDENLDIENFMNEMQESTEATGSAAPSPQSWIDAFEQADIIFAITISSKLSGSWQSLRHPESLAPCQGFDICISVLAKSSAPRILNPEAYSGVYISRLNASKDVLLWLMMQPVKRRRHSNVMVRNGDFTSI